MNLCALGPRGSARSRERNVRSEAQCECDRMAEEKRRSLGIKNGTVIHRYATSDTERTTERIVMFSDWRSDLYDV